MMRSHRSLRNGAAIALLCLLGSGCASIPAPYRPARVGMLPDANPVDGLVMTLQPDRTSARIGDLITFHIKIKNMGNRSVMIPTEPDILLTWIYPDGRCDNFVRDERSDAAPLVLTPLAPGEERLYRSAVTTYYFPRSGVTEFRACFSVNRTGQVGDTVAWTGSMASNGYGVLFN